MSALLPYFWLVALRNLATSPLQVFLSAGWAEATGKQAQENQKDDSAGLDFHVRFLDVVRWEQRPIDL